MARPNWVFWVFSPCPFCRREPVMTSPVGINRTESTFFQDHVLNLLKTACCIFLLNKKHAVVFIRRVIHRNTRILLLARNPFMDASVVMDHHPGQGTPGSSLRVRFFLLEPGHIPLSLEGVFDPSGNPFPPPGDARNNDACHSNRRTHPQSHDLLHRCSPVGGLYKTPVGQCL